MPWHQCGWSSCWGGKQAAISSVAEAWQTAVPPETGEEPEIQPLSPWHVGKVENSFCSLTPHARSNEPRGQMQNIDHHMEHSNIQDRHPQPF